MDRRSGLESVGLRKKKNPSTKSTPMAVTVETLEVELGGATHAFPVIDLRDRRKRGNPKKRWALVRATELLLFDVHDRSRGRFAAHLVRSSMDDALLVADRAAVTSSLLYESELQAGAPIEAARGSLLSQKPRLASQSPFGPSSFTRAQCSTRCASCSTSRAARAATRRRSCRCRSSSRP